jgi:hypothetical protein
VKTRPPLVLAGLVAGAIVVRLWEVHQFAAPQVLCDEFIYGDLARHFAESGHLLLRGEPSVKSLYPVLIAPAWLLSSTVRSYELAKAINVVLMTLVAVPVYLWARRLVSPGYALLAAALVLLIPSFHFAGLLMTESVFLTAFVLALYGIALAVEAPTLRRQLLALLLIGLAYAVRVQGLVLVAVLPSALLLKALLDLHVRPRGRPRAFARALVPFWPTAALFAAAAVVYAAVKAVQGASLSSGLGT